MPKAMKKPLKKATRARRVVRKAGVFKAKPIRKKAGRTIMPADGPAAIREMAERLGFVVMTHDEHRALLERAEDAGTARVLARSRVTEPRETMIPLSVSRQLAVGEESRLRILRKWRGMEPAELAAAADISPPYLSQIETGKRDGARYMPKLAKALNVSLELLLGE